LTCRKRSAGAASARASLGDEPRPSHPVFGLGRKAGIAATVEVRSYNFRKAVAAHVEGLTVLRAVKQRDLLLIPLE